jgi:hypothetical protein
MKAWLICALAGAMLAYRRAAQRPTKRPVPASPA